MTTQTSGPVTDREPQTTLPDVKDGLDFAALEQLAARLAPRTAPMAGTYRGRILAVSGTQRLPRPLRGYLHRVIARLAAPIWRGKAFDAQTGSNLWLSSRRPRAFAAFRQDAQGDRTPLVLDYDVAQNIGPLRPLTGQLWELGPGILLGRMQLTLGGRSRTLLYFTLDS